MTPAIGRRAEADEQRDAAAIDQSGQVVAPETIRPQDVVARELGLPERSPQPLREILRVGIVRCQLVGEKRDRDPEQ